MTKLDSASILVREELRAESGTALPLWSKAASCPTQAGALGA